MTNLFPPIYPPLARTARVEGDVRLLVRVRTDDTVGSVQIVGGNQLLQYSAVQSAQQSKFECRGCTEPVTSYEMVYSFQLVTENCPGEQDSVSNVSKDTRQLGVSQSGDRVMVVAEHGCFSIDYATISMPKVRSLKCLYLWPCVRPNKPGVWK